MLVVSGSFVCSLMLTFAFLTFHICCLNMHFVGVMPRQRCKGEEFSARNGGRGRQSSLFRPYGLRHLRNTALFGGRLSGNQVGDRSWETRFRSAVGPFGIRGEGRVGALAASGLGCCDDADYEAPLTIHWF